MALKFYNTLTRGKEIFKPLNDKKVGMYVCGPTIYGPSHLGHARTYLAFDLIRRYLEYQGFRVKYVMNITDIHDDMIKQAAKEKLTIEQLTNKYLPLFHQDMEKLGVKKADVYPQVSEHIPEIIQMIKKLLEKEFAYQKNGAVYYDISKFKNYGRLSGIKTTQAKTGTRVKTDKYTKKNLADFVLWKTAQANEPSWESPWSKGRPGWHIECSVMSKKYLGEQFDIHGGARDLIFPHHENEIAQSEATTNQSPFVKYWLHAGLLKVNGQKMSKSLGNYIELPDILKKYPSLVVRYFLIRQHYRSPLDFTEEKLKQAQNGLEKIWQFTERLNSLKSAGQGVKLKIKDWQVKIEKYLDDDLNTPRALAAIFDLIKKANQLIDQNKLNQEQTQQIKKLFTDINQVLGILKPAKKIIIPEKMKKLIQQREQARQQQNWLKADQLRKQIEQEGFKIEDTEKGSKLSSKY